MPLTQEELADTMGLTPEHMNKCLQTLRSHGLIASEGKRVFVADLQKLMAFSEFDPLYLHQEQKITDTSSRTRSKRQLAY
jgi:DNA-binding transcriptional regulator YhcF (GntR family)